MTINPHAYNFSDNRTVLLIGTSLDQTSNDSGRQNCAITYSGGHIEKKAIDRTGSLPNYIHHLQQLLPEVETPDNDAGPNR